MTSRNGSGQPAHPRRIDRFQSRRCFSTTRHPYVTSALAVIATALCIFMVKVLIGFPPLILFGFAAVACLVVLGVRAGVLALAFSALTGDFFFVEPLLAFTRHSFVLGAYYSLGILIAGCVVRKLIH